MRAEINGMTSNEQTSALAATRGLNTGPAFREPAGYFGAEFGDLHGGI